MRLITQETGTWISEDLGGSLLYYLLGWLEVYCCSYMDYGVEVNMDNTDKLVDLLIGLKREICEKYYGVNGCYQVDCYDKLHWCPMQCIVTGKQIGRAHV